VTLRLGEEVESVEELPDGTVVANLESKKRISGDALLYAVGRQGAVDDLNLAAAGLEADSRGRIPVDEHYQTKVEHIYAVGDVVGFPFAGLGLDGAGAHRRRARLQRSSRHHQPQLLSLRHLHHSRDQLHRQDRRAVDRDDVPYEVGMAYYRETARGQIRGDTTGRLKLIFHRDTRKVLGVHIIGEGASELVHIGQAVMILGGTVDYFIDTVFNYPTLAECYKVAAFNGLGRLHRYQASKPSHFPRRVWIPGAMTTAIGVVMTDHIVAGRLEDQRLTGKLLRYPEATEIDLDALIGDPRQRTGRDAGHADRRRWLPRRPRSRRSASPFPASSATAWSRTRPT
jgi:hypothetical protein